MRKRQLLAVRERYDRLVSEYNESACAEHSSALLRRLLEQAYRCGLRGEALADWLESREGEACRNGLDAVLDEAFCAGLLFRDTHREKDPPVEK